MESPTHGLDYSQITDTLFIGTNACCQMHFAQELLSKDVRADVSLEAERVDSPEGVDTFLWLPTEDHAPPSIGQLALGVAHLTELERRGIKTYVHCKNGHGRSPTLVAAFLIQERHLSADDAIAFIKAKRPSIHLEESQRQALLRTQA